MPLKRWLALLVAASLGASVLMGADAPQEPAKGSVLMRKKLEYTQKVLEGLALEDFDMIVKNARILRTFGGLEQWSRADSEAYRAQLKIFRFANDELIRLGEAKNLEGAALAYTQLTLSCVNCHSHVRQHAR